MRTTYPMDVSVEFDAESDETGLLAGLYHRRLSCTIERFGDLPEPLPMARHAALCLPVTETYLPWPAAAACMARLLLDSTIRISPVQGVVQE